MNNSVSGVHVLVHRGMLTAGLACIVNGWVGQWSVQVSSKEITCMTRDPLLITPQAADFSILAIAIVTLLTVTRKTYMPDAPLVKKTLICASVWLIPAITGKIIDLAYLERH
jgi:hypothetical protein